MTSGPQSLETQRLNLRPMERRDAAFVLTLVNEPGWLRYIGDKGIRTLDDATRYIEQGPQAMYRQFGCGLLTVTLRDTGDPIGMCGLLQRGWLNDVDLGFALLARYQRRGYAYEASSAVLAEAQRAHRLARVVAITSPDNAISGKLLGKLGFQFERLARLGPEQAELNLYARAL